MRAFASRLRSLLVVDTGDPETDRRGTTLLAALLLTACGCLVAAAVFWTAPSGLLSAVFLAVTVVLCLALIPVTRSGHVDVAVYGYLTLLWLLVIGQPASNGDLSTNATLVAPSAVLVLILLPENRRWMALAWIVTSLGALWLVTDDENTIFVNRTTQILNELVLAVTALLVTWYAAVQLLKASRRQREVAEALAEQETKLGEMERMANTDPLTGLRNRRALEPQLADARRRGPDTAVALIDLDNFKEINDNVSHGAGDQVLQRIASMLADSARGSDMTCRFGGDEFLLLATQGGTVGVTAALERLRDSVAASEWPQLPADLLPTLSAGVASAAGIPLHEALQRADSVLYEAKARGRDRVLVADHSS